MPVLIFSVIFISLYSFRTVNATEIQEDDRKNLAQPLQDNRSFHQHLRDILKKRTIEQLDIDTIYSKHGIPENAGKLPIKGPPPRYRPLTSEEWEKFFALLLRQEKEKNIKFPENFETIIAKLYNSNHHELKNVSNALAFFASSASTIEVLQERICLKFSSLESLWDEAPSLGLHFLKHSNECFVNNALSSLLLNKNLNALLELQSAHAFLSQSLKLAPSGNREEFERRVLMYSLEDSKDWARNFKILSNFKINYKKKFPDLFNLYIGSTFNEDLKAGSEDFFKRLDRAKTDLSKAHSKNPYLFKKILKLISSPLVMESYDEEKLSYFKKVYDMWNSFNMENISKSLSLRPLNFIILASHKISDFWLLPHHKDFFYEEFGRLKNTFFTDLPEYYRREIPCEGSKNSFEKGVHKQFEKVVYNQQGYESILPYGPYNSCFQEGKKLIYGNDNPIGYNIYFPTRPFKAVFTEIYGGASISAEDAVFSYAPGELEALKKYLLNQGIVIVTLNLCDLLKNLLSQDEMEQTVHQQLHESVHHYFQVMHDAPDSLHAALSELKGLPIYLYGASFGGGQAVRHAQLYPGTFSGYISHEGALSHEICKLGDRVLRETSLSQKASKWIVPSTDDENSDEKIIRIQEPVLLHQNYDDNNVNFFVSYKFWEKSQKLGKGALVSLLLTGRGGYDKNDPELINKGHFYSKDQEEFKRLTERFRSFIFKEPVIADETAEERRRKRYALYAYKNYNGAVLLEKFISEAFRIFETANLAKELEEADYKRLYREEFIPKALRTFENNSLAEKGEEADYKHTYLALHFYEHLKNDPVKRSEEIKRLTDKKLLSTPIIRETLRAFMPDYLEFLREYHDFNIPYTWTLIKFTSLEEGLSKWISDDRTEQDFHLYLLKRLYLANPHLVPAEYKEQIFSNALELEDSKRALSAILERFSSLG